MLLVHCIAQKACNHIWKIQSYLLWMWCTALMSPPFYLLESWLEVQAGKMSSIYQTLQKPPVSWAWVGVLFVHALRQQKSIQKCRPPSIFLTNTTALHHALWLGLIVPDSSISHKWLWTSSASGRGIHLNCSLKGVSSVTFIMYSV